MHRITKANNITAEKKRKLLTNFMLKWKRKITHLNFYHQPTKTNDKYGTKQVTINLDPNHRSSNQKDSMLLMPYRIVGIKYQ